MCLVTIYILSNRGKLRLMLYGETVLICFLARLIRDTQARKVFLILDNLRVHHSKKVALESTTAKSKSNYSFCRHPRIAYATQLGAFDCLVNRTNNTSAARALGLHRSLNNLWLARL